MANQFKDNFNRKFYYLRLSVTDVCNFKCTYCLPDGYKPESNQRESFLTLDEIKRTVSAFARCGTSKVRITGGEPSLRKDFTEIIRAVASQPGITKIAATTNGYRMANHIASWREAGLTDINVSVDSLNPQMFYQITGENKFAEVMTGIDKAIEVGFKQVKVNTVLLKDLNSTELPLFLKWIKTRPIQLRFIELMQTGEISELFKNHHQSGVSIRNHLIANNWILKPRSESDGPAQVFTHPDYMGEIGLIMPYEKDFCQSCNRLRVSAKGKLHMCLFGDYGIDLRSLLQDDSQQDELIQLIQVQLDNKVEGHSLQSGNFGSTPNLAFIGG